MVEPTWIIFLTEMGGLLPARSVVIHPFSCETHPPRLSDFLLRHMIRPLRGLSTLYASRPTFPSHAAPVKTPQLFSIANLCPYLSPRCPAFPALLFTRLDLSTKPIVVLLASFDLHPWALTLPPHRTHGFPLKNFSCRHRDLPNRASLCSGKRSLESLSDRSIPPLRFFFFLGHSLCAPFLRVMRRWFAP